ncbi:MAG: Photosystem I assembly protein Ycf3 [Saprospiraceae bacterium]|nr:Photosystem I assembly protein Ycf3 [Saprospiraceae bacterium]
MNKLYILLILFGGPVRLAAQTNVDSLWHLWSETSNQDTVRLKAIQDLAWSYIYSNPDSTALLAQMELELAWKINSKKWQGKALNVLGGSHHVKGEYVAALNEYKKALTALLEAGELKSAGALYNNIGLIYRERGNNSKAIEFYQKHLEIGERLKDNGILSSANNNLGTVYSDLGNYPKALEYYEKGLQLAEKASDKSGIAIGHNNIGSVYMIEKKIPQAIEQYQKSLVIRKELDDQRGIALVYGNIGLVHRDQKDYPKALEYFRKALEIQEKLGDKPGLASSYFNLGSTFNEQNEFAKAAEWCARGLAISEQIDALRPARNVCNCLYEAYKGMGQSDKALVWHERYITLNDSLQKEEATQRLEQMEFAKQVLADSLGQEEEKLKMEMAYQSEVRKRDRITNILLVSGLALLALAVGSWSRMLYFRKYSEMFQHKAENLEKQQLLNEIALLRTQVNPHFLFNSLSILSSLVRTNPDLSEQFIDQLSRSYRYVLEQKEQSLVTLRTELEFIRSYCFLLKIRFESKFDMRFDLPDPLLDRYKIAPLTLQLLVENAVKHNRMSLKEPLVVTGSFENETLVVKNKLQPRSTHAASTGLGLQNIINRYALLTNRLVWAGERENEFVVKIPLL